MDWDWDWDLFLKSRIENGILLADLRFSYKSSTTIACWSVSSSDQAPKLSSALWRPWKIVMSLKIVSSQSYSASLSSKMKKWVITFESSVNFATLESRSHGGPLLSCLQVHRPNTKRKTQNLFYKSYFQICK